MSQENVEIVRRANAMWNSGDRTLVLDMVDPKVEIHSPLSSVTGVPYRGLDGVRQWMADLDDQFAVWETRLEETDAVSVDRILVSGTVHARGRASGVELEWPTAMVVDFREGRLLSLTIYGNRAEARKAVGLVE